jgi:hypothetical protein
MGAEGTRSDERAAAAVTDITGCTDLTILDAIVAGARNPEALARLRDYRCKKSEAEIARALRGDWREEHFFTLRQLLEARRFQQNLMTDCDEQIASRVDDLEDRVATTCAPTTGSPAGGSTPPTPARSKTVWPTAFAWRRGRCTARRRGRAIVSVGRRPSLGRRRR